MSYPKTLHQFHPAQEFDEETMVQDLLDWGSLGFRVHQEILYHPRHWRPVEFGSDEPYDWCYYEAQFKAISTEAQAFAARIEAGEDLKEDEGSVETIGEVKP